MGVKGRNAGSSTPTNMGNICTADNQGDNKLRDIQPNVTSPVSGYSQDPVSGPTPPAPVTGHDLIQTTKPISRREDDEKFVLPISLAVQCLTTIFNAFDKNGDGVLDVSEVKGLMQAFQPDDHSKHISKKQKKKGVKPHKLKVTENQVNKLFANLDADGD